MRIGYYHDNYACRRNIIGIVPDLDYVRVHDIYEGVLRFGALNRRLFKHSLFDVDKRINKFNDLNINRVDIMHFFNDISFGKTPWITTFETVVPRFTHRFGSRNKDVGQRYEKRMKAALDAVSSDSCKKLIALSQKSITEEKELISRFPQYRSDIEAKIIQLHPPQKISVENYEEKKLALGGQLTFMFVGGAFFRKGGLEIIEALNDIRQGEGINLKLVVVSSLTVDYYDANIHTDSIKTTRQFMENNKDWIDVYSNLPNSKVIELMLNSHVGLLPTYSDTYGYSVLEFQSCGCPVISTNVRALPEINNHEIGWVIDVPIGHSGDALCTTEEQRAQTKKTIKQGLETVVSEILEDRNIIMKKANAGIDKIRTEHSPENYSTKLKSIYDQVMG